MTPQTQTEQPTDRLNMFLSALKTVKETFITTKEELIASLDRTINT